MEDTEAKVTFLREIYFTLNINNRSILAVNISSEPRGRNYVGFIVKASILFYIKPLNECVD